MGCAYNNVTGSCDGGIYQPKSTYFGSDEVGFAFCGVMEVFGSFFVSSSPAATLHCLTKVNGDFEWKNNLGKTLFPPSDSELALPLLHTLGGALGIEKNGEGLEVMSLPALSEVAKGVKIKNNKGLRGIVIDYNDPPTFGKNLNVDGHKNKVLCKSSVLTLSRVAQASGQKLKTNDVLDETC